MYSQWWILGGLIAYFLLSIILIIKGVIKKRGRYTLKKSVNDLRLLLTIIWTAYFFLGSALVMASTINWTSLQLLKWSPESGTYLVISGLPFVSLLTVWYLAVSIIVKASKPWIKYTEEELELLKRDKEVFNNRIRRLVPWLKK